MAFWNRSVFAGDADAEQRAEGRMAGVAAIEAEHELVEVGLQVLAAQAVVDAERPAFEVGEEAMCPGQDNVRGHRSDDVRVVSDAGSAGVSRPAIGFRGGAGGDIGVDESVQAGGGEVRDRRQPHPARPMAVHLDGAGDEHLALAAAAQAALGRIVLARLAFINANIAAGATAKTDGWSAYPGAPGITHHPHVVGPMAAHVVLPWAHRLFANLKRWALGVYHGLRRKHLQSYL